MVNRDVVNKDQVGRVNSNVGKNYVGCMANSKGANNNRGVSGGIPLPCSISGVHNTKEFYSKCGGGSTAACSLCGVRYRLVCHKDVKYNRAIYSRGVVPAVDNRGSSSSWVDNMRTWYRDRQTDRQEISLQPLSIATH